MTYCDAVARSELFTVNSIVVDHRFNSFRNQARLEGLTFGKDHAAGAQGAQDLLFARRVIEESVHITSQYGGRKWKLHLLSHEHYAIRVGVSPASQRHVKSFAAD